MTEEQTPPAGWITVTGKFEPLTPAENHRTAARRLGLVPRGTVTWETTEKAIANGNVRVTRTPDWTGFSFQDSAAKSVQDRLATLPADRAVQFNIYQPDGGVKTREFNNPREADEWLGKRARLNDSEVRNDPTRDR